MPFLHLLLNSHFLQFLVQLTIDWATLPTQTLGRRNIFERFVAKVCGHFASNAETDGWEEYGRQFRWQWDWGAFKLSIFKFFRKSFIKLPQILPFLVKNSQLGFSKQRLQLTASAVAVLLPTAMTEPTVSPTERWPGAKLDFFSPNCHRVPSLVMPKERRDLPMPTHSSIGKSPVAKPMRMVLNNIKLSNNFQDNLKNFF